MKTLKIQSRASDFLVVLPDEAFASDFLGEILLKSVQNQGESLTLAQVEACARTVSPATAVHELKKRDTMPAAKPDQIHPQVREMLLELGVTNI